MIDLNSIHHFLNSPKRVYELIKPHLNKRILYIAVSIITALAVFIFLAFGTKISNILFTWMDFQKYNAYKDKIVLFYGSDCTQCTNVDNFIKNNNVESNVAFTRLEVFHNTANNNILADKAQICGLDINIIGVPFLWDGTTQKCILGDSDVISYFRQKILKKR